MILQGSSYELPIYITDCDGNAVTEEDVTKGSFTFGHITKDYGDGGEVTFRDGAWIIPLSEEETFSLKGVIKWQARFLFVNGKPDGTSPKNEYIYDSINKRILSGGEDDAE